MLSLRTLFGFLPRRTASPHVIARTPRRTPARRYATRIDEPTLLQFVVLSMLVHLLAILLFGTTGHGGAGKASDLLGTLDVTLRRAVPEIGIGLRIAPGPSDSASSVRPLHPAPETKPRGAPPVKAPEGETARPSGEFREPVVPEAETPAPSPEESGPRLNRSAPDEVDKPLRPEVPSAPIAPPKIEAAPQPLETIAPPAITRELAPAIEAPAHAIPSAPTVPLERVVPPAVERALTEPAELPSQAVPVVPSTPLEHLAPPRGERELTPAPEPLRERAVEPGAPLERALPPTIERQLAPPVDMPTRALPAAPAAPLERIAPPTTERQLAPAAEVPVPARPSVQAPATPAPSSAPAARPATEPAPARAPTAEPRGPAAEPAPARPSAREPVERESIRPAPAPTTPAPRGITPGSIFDRTPGIETSPSARPGTPSPEEEIFKPRTDRPGEAASPRIDLDAAKKRAVREAGSGSTGVLPFPLPVPEKKTKEANAMDKAVKPDCRTAYAGMGLLAVPALVVAAVSDDPGCHW